MKRFFESSFFLILLSAITLIVWNYHLEYIGIPIVLVLMFLIFVFSKETMPTIPLLLNALFMVSQAPKAFNQIPLYLLLTPVVLVAGMVIHFIKYRVKLLNGAMMLGLLLMVGSLIISTIFQPNISVFYIFYLSIGVFYVVFYSFYRNSLSKDYVSYLLKLLFILGLLISAEIVLYYIKVDDIHFALEHKTIDLGWGISNYVATYLIMFIPVSFYYAKTKKYSFPFLLIAIIETILITFTASRGGMVAFACMLPILLVILLFRSKKKKLLLLELILIVDMIFIAAVLNHEFVESIFSRFSRLLLDDSGRIEIWKNGIDIFLKSPIYGGGLFARDANRDYNMFHNTFIHTAATMGVIGLFALFIQLFTQIWVPLKGFKDENLFVAAALIGANLHGMVDNVYYMPQFILVMLLIVSVFEVKNQTIVNENLKM